MNTSTQQTGPGAKAAETLDPTGQAADAGRTLWNETRDEARHLKDEATSHVRERAEGVKETVADEVSSVGDALRKASNDLRKGSPQEQIFGSVAESLAGFADAVRGRDVTELVNEVSRFGRRNPGAFLGGAALLGFAAVRMARASESRGADERSVEAARQTPLGTSRPQPEAGEYRQPAHPKAEV